MQPASLQIVSIDHIVAANVRRLRESHVMPDGSPMRMGDLAELLDVSIPMVSRYETGTTPIPNKKLAVLSAFFKVPMQSFFVTPDTEHPELPSLVDGNNVVPLLEAHEIPEWFAKRRIDSRKVFDITKVIRTKVSNPRAFAYCVPDDSMSPLYHRGDVLVFNPEREPRPQKTVIAVTSKGLIVLGQYKERGFDPTTGEKLFDVIPLNRFFGDYSSDRDGLKILGTWAELRRYDDDEMENPVTRTAIH